MFVPHRKGFTGVRFSLYPQVSRVDGSADLTANVPAALHNLESLGLEARHDDVSVCLLGAEPALFEAVRAAFGRAAREGLQVGMQCTFSAGCPGEPDESPLPPRSVGEELISDAVLLPSRVVCQFAVYPLGAVGHMDIIYEVISQAKQSPAYKSGVKTHFCSMLDGDGIEVFDVLRRSWATARKRAGHVVMTATITSNMQQ